MYEAARINATIELLAECETAWQSAKRLPVDVLLQHYFKARRFIGSKDRGAISSLFYLIIRNLATLQWHMEQHKIDGPRALAITALMLMQKKSLPDVHNIFNGERFSASKLSGQELAYAKAIVGKELVHPKMPEYAKYNFPEWLGPEIESSLGQHWKEEVTALSQEAPVDLRTNTLLTTRDALIAALKEEGFEVEPTPLSPIGVRMRTRAPVFTSKVFKQGWFEMQDEGSQLVSLLLDAKPGEKVIDFCAGAGGKTLAIAATMKNKGRILAWDTSEKRLKQMSERLRRAKVDNVQTHVLDSEHDAFIKRHKDSADAVIVDAPCSGSGTWRRNPDLKWRFNEKDLHEVVETQKRILESAARLVKVGGRILYITCSILKSENESQLQAFMSQKENFRVVTENNLCSNITNVKKTQGGYIHLTPRQDGTDGFFATLLQRLV